MWTIIGDIPYRERMATKERKAMGYYKNIDVEQQQAIDDIIAWWKSHEGRVPDYLLKMVVEDRDFWPKVRDRWVAEELKPRRATSHVALQPSRRQRRVRKWDLSMSHGDAVVILSMFTVITIIEMGLAIWMAVTL
jgi:hypothetical protein